MKGYAKKQAGVALVEVLIALGIIASILVAVGFSVATYVSARSELLNNTKALYLAEEGYEMLRVLRDEDWNIINDLNLDTIYYFDVSTTTIAISTTPEVIDDNFYRSFVLQEVYRDNNDDITSSTTAGASVDIGSLYVTVSVGYLSGTSSLQALITNMYAI